MENIKNSVLLTGKASTEPVIVGFADNKRLARVSLEVEDFYQNILGEPVKRTQYFNLIFWNEKVTLIENLKKHGEIFIKGSLSSPSYTDKSGTVRSTMEIIVSEVLSLINP